VGILKSSETGQSGVFTQALELFEDLLFCFVPNSNPSQTSSFFGGHGSLFISFGGDSAIDRRAADDFTFARLFSGGFESGICRYSV